ncbi:MAG: hypothetical protein ACR2HR_01245 [Euzebya sp.]
MPSTNATSSDTYDSGLLVAPAAEVTANAMTMAVHHDDVGDLLIALLGWDQAVQSLVASPHPRATRILPSVLSWLLVR